MMSSKGAIEKLFEEDVLLPFAYSEGRFRNLAVSKTIPKHPETGGQQTLEASFTSVDPRFAKLKSSS